MTVSKEPRLTQGSVTPLLFRLTWPMVLGILSLVTFNLADTFFVGRLGIQQLAALSFTFPVVLVLNSMAMGLGIGVSAVISRSIGQGKKEEVRRLTTDSLILGIGLAAVFITAGFFTIDPVFRLLGAGPDTLPMIRDYMRIWYPGVLFVIVPMTGNNAIRAAGDTRTPGLIMTWAAVSNLILDPLFIFGLGPVNGLGIRGAALATVLSRMASMVASLYVLIHREDMIRLSRPDLQELKDSIGKIFSIALPAAATRVVIPLGTGILTRMVAMYGPEAVAGFGVATRIEFFAMAPVMALASVIGPFVGQNLGARLCDRVQEGVTAGYRFSLFWGLGCAGALALSAEPLVNVFTASPGVVERAVMYLRIVPAAYAFMGILVTAASVLNVMKRPWSAGFFSIIQMFGLAVPLGWTGNRIIGIPGIFAGLAVSYLVSGLAARHWLNRLLDMYRTRRHNAVNVPGNRLTRG